MRLKWTSPAQHVYCYSVYPSLCVFPPSFCLSFLVYLLPKQPKQAAILLFRLFSPLPDSPLRLSMPCFPYFGMSMCYLLTLCMNDNMSVYSYRESYPIPLVLTKNGLNVVQIQVFCSSFILFSYIIIIIFLNVCRA